jgi:uridine phosphorylase
MLETTFQSPPILRDKYFEEATIFTPESILREARRQKGLANGAVPTVCVLDPDGDMVRQLKAGGRAEKDPDWACYHTELYRVSEAGLELGIVPCAVGASFAVLIAEQLFASGCKLLISVTSSGQLVDVCPPPYFVLIEKALRDEGTSYHYLSPSEFSDADPALLAAMTGGFDGTAVRVERGATWTTDAPFRETASAVAAMRERRLLAVEMEAAALYAFSAARRKPVLCFAHVTNRMGAEGDFEKGEADGLASSLLVVATTAKRCRDWLVSSMRSPDG